jgi:hypothetical protein
VPFEIWIVSTAEPVAFQPERVPLPPFDDQNAAQLRARAYDAADRRAIVIERDDDGNVIPNDDETAIAQQSPPTPPVDVDAGGTPGPTFAELHDANDRERTRRKHLVFGGAANSPEWEHRAFVDLLIDRWRDRGLITGGGALETGWPELAAQVARDLVIDMLALDVQADDVAPAATVVPGGVDGAG